MILRSIVVCTLGCASLAAATLSGFRFSTFSPVDLPAAWQLNLAACVLVFLLGISIKGGRFSVALVLSILAICLPAVGPALAAMTAMSIHFMRPARGEDDPFVIGNPVTTNGVTDKPSSILCRPLVESVRRLSDKSLIRLLTGIDSLTPRDARPILLHLSGSEDAQIQLFAQGGLNDFLDAAENNLKALTKRASQHPGEVATQCAIAEIQLHLLENHLVEEDDRATMLSAAHESIGKALKGHPNDALSLKVSARLSLIAGKLEEAKIAAKALAYIPGHAESAQLILSEIAFEEGELNSVATTFKCVQGGTACSDAINDFWRRPKPSVYV